MPARSPGPACYGRGGMRATVTDANLVLGFLDPGGLLGGRMKLDRAAAEVALTALGQKLGLDATAAAAGVWRVINGRMAEGIRLVSVRRGVDPTGFALLAFGGAAGLHVADVARQLSMRRVVVPRVASVLSAWGMLASDIRYEVSRTHIGDSAALTDAGLREIFEAMDAEGRTRLARDFDGPVRSARSADMRYGEQIFEINVPLDGLDWEAPGLAQRIADRFHARHEELYTYSQRGNEVVLVNARCAVIGALPALPEEPVVAHRRQPSRSVGSAFFSAAGVRFRSIASRRWRLGSRSRVRLWSKARRRWPWSASRTPPWSRRTAGSTSRLARHHRQRKWQAA